MENETKLRIRSLSEGGKRYILGYAAVFNKKSKVIYEGGKRFVEVVEKGAFDEVLQSSKLNVVANVNHDDNLLLGRTKANTLQLTVDNYGLQYKIEVPETQLGNDIYTNIELGNYDESSFRFASLPKNISYKQKADVLVRYVKKVDVLADISIVTNAAYEGTSTNARSKETQFFTDEFIENATCKNGLCQRFITDYENTNTQQNRKTNMNIKRLTGAEALKDINSLQTFEKVGNRKKDSKKFSIVEGIRQLVQEKELSGEELRVHNRGSKNMDQKIPSSLFLDSKALRIRALDTTTGEGLTYKDIYPEVDIIVPQPVYRKLGVSVIDGLVGNFSVTFGKHNIAEFAAEGVALVANPNDPDAVVLSPKRIGLTKSFPKEVLTSMKESVMVDIIKDMVAGIDSGITKKLFE